MVKMLMLDGPLAGQLMEVVHGWEHVQAIDAPRADLRSPLSPDLNAHLVTYVPRRFMFGARIMVLGCCRQHDRRELEQLMFEALASDVAKDIAGPLPRFVCDHQAADVRCPRGCHGDGTR